MNVDTNKTNVAESSIRTSPPVWFWVISIVTLLWYLMDMSAFFMRVLITEEAFLTMPENQRLHFQSIPLWVNVVFAFEVFGGTLGCIALLLRKKLALPLFIVSLVGVLSQTTYVYFLSNSIATIGTPAVVMPLVAIMICVGLIILVKSSMSKRWL